MRMRIFILISLKMRWLRIRCNSVLRRMPILRKLQVYFYSDMRRTCIVAGVMLLSIICFVMYGQNGRGRSTVYHNMHKRAKLRHSKLEEHPNLHIVKSSGVPSGERGMQDTMGLQNDSEKGTLPVKNKQAISNTMYKPDKYWLAQRSASLNNTKLRKVLLYSYQLDGPSILQSLLNHDRRALVFPEALDVFYSAAVGYPSGSLPLDLLYYWNTSLRVPGANEKHNILNHLMKLWSCSLTSVAPEMWYHPKLGDSLALKPLPACVSRAPGAGAAHPLGTDGCKQHLLSHCGSADATHRDISTADRHNCVEIINHLNKLDLKSKSAFEIYSELDKRVQPSLTNLEKLENFMNHKKCVMNFKEISKDCADFGWRICRHYQMRVAAVNRLNTFQLEMILDSVPDLFVIYLIRDPRWEAVRRAASASLAWHPSTMNTAKEAKILCKRMRSDLLIIRKLDQKYPGAVLAVRYEDVIEGISRSSVGVYRWLGVEPPASLDAWKLEALDAEVICRDEFGPFRCPPAVYTQLWRKGLSPDELIHLMTARCQDVLEAWKYGL